MPDKDIATLPALPSGLTGADRTIISRPGAGEDYKGTMTEVLTYVSTNLAVGATFLFGTSAPTGGVGSNSDIYLKTDEGKLYKKIAGTWVLQITFATNAKDGTVLYGTVVPTTQGDDGDTWIRTTHGTFYQKASGSWTLKFSMATGPAGANGKSVLNGVGVPSSGLGSNGEFYIDTVAKLIYGPKTAGVWGTGVSIVGPTGAAGSTGASGAGFIATSVTSNSIGTGSKTFTTQAGLAYGIGEFVFVVKDISNYMYGQITAYSTTSITVNVLSVVGSGTHTSWSIRLVGEKGAQGDPGPDITRKGTFTMLAGVGTINEAGITANTYVFLGVPSGYVTPGHTKINSRVIGTSITIGSSDAGENSTYPYILLEP